MIFHPTAAFADVVDMGVGYCSLHGSYRGPSCPKCAASGGTPGYGSSSADQLLISSAGELGAALGQLLLGDPQRAAQLQAEARERALALQREAEAAERAHQANIARIRGELKIDSFDGDNGGLLLKGVEVGATDDHGLKLDDDDLKPLGTRAVANTGPPGAPAPNTDPMVVDLRNYRRAAFLATFPEVSPEAVFAASQGDTSIIAICPPEALRAIPGDGLRKFQEANDAFHQTHHDGEKAAEYFNRAQAQREIASRELNNMKAELERQLAQTSDTATLARQHQLMGQIFAAARVEHELWVSAKAELDATRAREAFERAQVLRLVSNVKPGVDMAPIAVDAPPSTPANTPARDRQITLMNALAADMRWPEEDRARLKTAFESLKLDGTDDVASWEIRQTWKSVLARDQDGELAREASGGEGPGIPGASAGKQTSPMDCTIFALANATGLPYPVVAGRAILLIEHADWRPADQKAHPQHVVQDLGLNGDEMIMLAESFGEARVVTSANFPQTLAKGSPILVDVSPRNGSVTDGHQVVLTKVFLHEGKPWYEMINSTEGPMRRLYLSSEELGLLLIENGVSFTPDPGTVPVLLRPAGTQ